MREFGAIGTAKGPNPAASMSTMGTSSQADVRHHGSFGRLSSMFNRGTMSTVKAKSVTSVYEPSVTDTTRQSHEHIHDEDEEDGLENVRACCGGTTSPLPESFPPLFCSELTFRK